MKILINGIGSKFGGSAADFINIIWSFTDLAKDDEYFIYASRALAKEFDGLPENFHILSSAFAEANWIFRFLFDQVVIPLFIASKGIKVFIGFFNFAVFISPVKQVIRITNDLCFSGIALRRAKFLNAAYFARVTMLRYLIVLSIKKADRVIFLSNALKADVARYFKKDIPAEKCLVSYNGINEGRFAIEESLSDELKQKMSPVSGKNPFYILYPAYYYFHKNFDTLFKALPDFKRSIHGEFKLVLTIYIDKALGGSYGWDNAVKLMEDLSIAEDIIFLGNIPYSKMHLIYKACQMVVFPSSTEACPNPLLEAMFHGLPIVASDIPAHKELCQNAALYFKVFDPQDLAQKLALVAKDKELYNRFAKEGKNRCSRFSWRVHAEKLYHAIEN